jgi:UDP-N-acetylglucosamine 2-epimerase (non-hydrolysing)
MRKVAVVTVARSDYGILRPVLNELRSRDGIDLELIVTGMHLDPRFGMTVSEIEADGMEIAHRVDTLRAGDDAADIAVAMGREIAGLSEVFAVSRPDILVIMGDRFEMLAAAVAATPFNIAIAHIHGGEASFGAIDDAMRHAITKLSHLHFPATMRYGKRIARMGEQVDRITVAGAPGLDNIAALELPDPAAVGARFGFSFDPDNPPVLITFHPETRSRLPAADQIGAVLTALNDLDRPLLFTMPNADSGGLEIADLIQAYCAERGNATLVDNLGTANYFAMLGVAPAMVGNSSSGIIEAASFELPVVNVGNRQRGRDCGENVLHCSMASDDITRAMARALSPSFRDSLRGMRNIYGDGSASKTIVDRIQVVDLGEAFLAKEFNDLADSERSLS